MIQHLTRRLIDLAVPPRAHGERWSAADGVEAVYIDLARLSDAALESVRCDMLAVQQAAYCRAESATPEALQERLREHVWSSTEDRSVFSQAVLFYAAGLPIGVLHCHAVEMQLAGRACEIVRAGVNVAPAFRSLGLTSASFHVIGAAYLRQRAWTRTPRVYVGYCMSPMTFRYVHRRTPQCYPGPNAVDPLLVELHAALFGEKLGDGLVLPEVAGSSPSPRTDAFLRAHRDDPYLRFYLDVNPRYQEGFTMPIVVRGRPMDWLVALGRSVWLGARKGLRVRRETGRSVSMEAELT